MDGLGRNIQEVIKQNSYNGNDVVTPRYYDSNGLEKKKFLSFESATNDGSVKGQPFASLQTFYQGTPQVATSDYPFTYQHIERSPFTRLLSQSAVGDSWTGLTSTVDNHDIQSGLRVNGNNEVIKWQINASGLPYYGTQDQYFDIGKLFLNTINDEHGNETIEYTNNEGLVLLKKVYAFTGGPSLVWHETYYIYMMNSIISDMYFLPLFLRMVLPSSDLDASTNTGWIHVTEHTTINDYQSSNYSVAPGSSLTIEDGFEFTASTGISFEAGPERKGGVSLLFDLIFQYKYDERNRIIAKKLPGAEWVHFVYDQWNRLVLTQDGIQRLNNQWLFTKYDVLNRPIMTGIYVDTRSIDDIRIALAASNRNEDRNSSLLGYSLNQSYPRDQIDATITEEDLLTVTYYDDYDFIVTNWDQENPTWPTSSCTCIPEVRGQITGIKTKNLTDQSWLNSTIHYDNRYRVNQTFYENLTGGIDVTTNSYSFSGNLLTVINEHNGHESHTVTRTFKYDHGDRLTEIRHQLDTEPEIILLKNDYNSIGELTNKKLHSSDFTNFNQEVDYRYNVRGWLSEINDPSSVTDDKLFGMRLRYEDADTPSYNGNVGEMEWGSLTNAISTRYDFTYDPLNRINSAVYSGGTGENYTVSGYYI